MQKCQNQPISLNLMNYLPAKKDDSKDLKDISKQRSKESGTGKKIRH